MAAFAPFHPRTEEMRALRTQLLIRWYNPEQGRKSLVVASPDAGFGYSGLSIDRQDPDVGRPVACPLRFVVAGVDEDPVDPRL